MAIYTVEQGQLVKVAATLEDYVGVELIHDYDIYLRQQGFSLIDEQVHAYQMHTRYGLVRTGLAMPDITYIFDVTVNDDSVEYIVIPNDLGVYLDVLKKLEPLVNRGLRLQAELARERSEYPED